MHNFSQKLPIHFQDINDFAPKHVFEMLFQIQILSFKVVQVFLLKYFESYLNQTLISSKTEGGYWKMTLFKTKRTNLEDYAECVSFFVDPLFFAFP